MGSVGASVSPSEALLIAALGVPAAQAQQPASGELETSTQLTDRERIHFAQGALWEISVGVDELGELLAAAEAEGDVIRIQCVTKKLAAVRSLHEVSQRAEAAMLEALAGGDTGRADQEFRKIAVALSKTRQFRAEAEHCVGATEVVEASPPPSTPDLLPVQLVCDSLLEDAEHYSMEELERRLERLQGELSVELVSCLAAAGEIELARAGTDLLMVRSALRAWTPGEPLEIELLEIEGDDRVPSFHAAGLFVVALRRLENVDRGMASYTLTHPDLVEFGDEFSGRVTSVLDAPAASSPELLGARAAGLLEDPVKQAELAGMVEALLVLGFAGTGEQPVVTWELVDVSRWAGSRGVMRFRSSEREVPGGWETVARPEVAGGVERPLLWGGAAVAGAGLATVGTTAVIDVTTRDQLTIDQWRALAATQVVGWGVSAVGVGLLGGHLWMQRRDREEER